ncbi:hypothetical protein Tco_0337234 [Tanacetum coccineum]
MGGKKVNGNGNGGVNGNGNGGVNGNGGGNDNGNVDTSLIHLESRKSPTAELFDLESGRISIVTVNTKEYHFDVLAIIIRIMRRTLDNSL